MNLLPLLALVVFARGGGGSPAAKSAVRTVRGKSGRAYMVIRVPSRTKRFRVQFQPATPKGKKKPPALFWEADFDGPKFRPPSVRANADQRMLDDVMAFPVSVWE